MKAGRLIVMGVVAGTLWGTAGCANSSNHKAHWPSDSSQPVAPPAVPSSVLQPVAPSPQSTPARKVDQMDAQGGSVDALARKAEAYSHELGPLLRARSATASQSPTAPSQVQWLDPSEFRIGDSDARPSSDTKIRSDRASVVPAMDPGPADALRAPSGAGNAARADLPAKARPGEQTTLASADLPSRVVPRAAPAVFSADSLEDKLGRRIRDYPRDVSAHLEYQLLQFLLDEPTPQLAALSSLPSEDRELVTAVLDGLTNFRNALRADSNMLLSKKIKPILDMSERLRAQADLTIPAIALCTRVNGFGNYDPIDPARFDAGNDHPVIVYCEIANFASNLNDKQAWETRLTWDMTLYTEQGMSVWSDKTESISDVSRNRRHDFFVRKMVTLPRTLTIGRYLLKVSIVDIQSNRVAEATVPIVIAAAP